MQFSDLGSGGGGDFNRFPHKFLASRAEGERLLTGTERQVLAGAALSEAGTAGGEEGERTHYLQPGETPSISGDN